MTIHLFHPHDHSRQGALAVFLDDVKVAGLAQGKSADVNGSGQPQRLVVRLGPAESPVLMVTDPGPGQWVGVKVSYLRFRGLCKAKTSLMAEFIGNDSG